MRRIGAACLLVLTAVVSGCGEDTGGTGGGAQSAASTGAGGAGGATASASSSPSASSASSSSGAGGDGGANGGGGQGGGNGVSQACQDCNATVFAQGTACLQTIEDCDADADCTQWKDCAEACFNDNDTAACYDACDAAWPQVTDLKAALYKCLCDACSAVCVAACT